MIVRIFRLFDNGQPVGEFTAREIAMMLGCHHQTVYAYEEMGRAWKDRWTIERLDKDKNLGRENWRDMWSDQWKRETERWKNSGRDLAKIRIVGKE